MKAPESLAEALKSYSKYIRIILAVLIFAAGAFLFRKYLLSLLLAASVPVTAWFVKKAEAKTLGIETATIATVIIAYVFGPLIGAASGLVLVMLQIVAGQYTGSYIIWVIPAYGAAGFISGTLTGMEIATLGSLITVGLQLAFAFLTTISPMGELPRYLPYAVSNLLINLVLFNFVAPVLMPLMA